jgi:integrase
MEKAKSKAKNSTIAQVFGVTLRYNTNKTGTKSLYLDIHKQGKRYKEYLGNGFLLVGNTTTDKETLRVAKEIMLKRASEIREQGVSVLSTKSKADVFAWLRKDAQSETRRNLRTVIHHLKAFLGLSVLPFRAIDSELIRKFQDYCTIHASANASHTYMISFKASMTRARKQGYLTQDHFSNIDSIKRTETERSYLSTSNVKQLQAIYDTEREILLREMTSLQSVKEQASINRNHHEVLRAFLFACFAGLRISDVKKLTWEQFNENGITIRQTKTRSMLTVPVNQQAWHYIGNRGDAKSTDKVFHILSSSTISRAIKSYGKRIGVKAEDISFHTSRHTHGTALLSKGARMEVVSKLLGHTDIKTTQIYAKVIDSVKAETSSLLDEL